MLLKLAEQTCTAAGWHYAPAPRRTRVSNQPGCRRNPGGFLEPIKPATVYSSSIGRLFQTLWVKNITRVAGMVDRPT